MTDQAPEPSGRKPLAAFLLVAVFLVTVIVVVARLPGSTPAGSTGTTGTATNLHRTGRALIGVDIEVPPPVTGPSPTTTTSKSHATTTTVRPGGRPVPPGAVVTTLRGAGFTVVAVSTVAAPPLTTEIQYLPHELGAALTVRTILRLPSSSVSAYSGPSTGLPADTNLIVLVGSQG